MPKCTISSRSDITAVNEKSFYAVGIFEAYLLTVCANSQTEHEPQGGEKIASNGKKWVEMSSLENIANFLTAYIAV